MSSGSVVPKPALPRFLELGNLLSRGEEGTDDPFFEIESKDKKPERFLVDPDLMATGRTCVIGSSGSGKSYAVGVICEEMCKSGAPFVIVDVEGEFSGLKEKFEAIWVGDDKGCDLNWNEGVNLNELAEHAAECPPIIFDVSETSRPREKVNQFLISLYREISRRRTPYLVIIEEADRFCPQSGGERLPIIDEIARRGRKRGLGLLLCTQRPSLVEKNVLSQCSNQLVGRLVIKNDLSAVAQFFPEQSILNSLTRLKPGEFFALGSLAPQPEMVSMRKRETGHGGITPKLKAVAIRPSVENFLESMRTPTSRPVPLDDPQPTKSLEPEEVQAPPSALPVTTKNSEVEVVEVNLAPKMADGEGSETHDEPLAVEVRSLPGWEREKSRDGVLGLAPMIEAESVPKLVKLGRSYKVFGHKENVMRVALVFRPLVEVGVRIRSGVIKRKFLTKYFFLDGMSGRLIEVTDRLGFKSGVERLLGLGEGQIVILGALHPERDLSLIEVASISGRSEDEARNLLKRLEDKRLVRSVKMGRTRMYRRTTDVPKIRLASGPLLRFNELLGTDRSQLERLKIKEDQVREVVKGLWRGADIDSFTCVYYPLYVAEVMLRERKRYVWIDGRTGKETDLNPGASSET